MRTAIFKFLGLMLAIGLAGLLYYIIQARSTVGCTVDPRLVSFSNVSGAFMSSAEISEEIFAKYLEAHHIGGVCPDRVISGYKINNVTIRKDGEESFVAHAVFDISPLDNSGSSWLAESSTTEDLFIKDITRDFIVTKEEDGSYSILDVIEE